MERIFKIKTKSDRDPQAQYPSERRYSASIVIGLSVVFLQLFLYSVLMGTLIVHKMADNNQKNITTDDHMELAVLEEKLQRDLEHHDEVSINIPALVCSGCFLMALGYFLSFSTGLLAWKRWYVDHNITFFFLASTFSTLTSALSLLLALLTCLNLDLDYDSYSNTPSPFPPLTISLDMNIIVLSSVGVIWSVLAARVGYRGMRNSYLSVLGPLIFLLYINDLPQHIGCTSITLFADDTSISAEADSPVELQSELNNIGDRFTSWCHKNRLIVNAQKTVLIQFFGKKVTESNITVKINNITIQPSETTKFLGTYIDSALKWQVHINHVCKKINSSFYALLQLKKVLDVKNLVDVYYAMVNSVLSYNILLWGNGTNIDRAFIGQKRIIRLVYGLRYTESCRPIFKKHKILTLPSIFIYHCIIYVKKHESKFETNRDLHAYPTRSGNLLRLKQHRTQIFEKSPFVAGPRFFNCLPPAIKEISAFSIFKRKVKDYLMEGSFYSVNEFLESKS